MGISHSTARSHIHAARRALGVRRSGAVVEVLRLMRERGVGDVPRTPMLTDADEGPLPIGAKLYLAAFDLFTHASDEDAPAARRLMLATRDAAGIPGSTSRPHPRRRSVRETLPNVEYV